MRHAAIGFFARLIVVSLNRCKARPAIASREFEVGNNCSGVSYLFSVSLKRAMGIEPTSEAWEPSHTCGDEKFWCNFAAVKEGERTEHFPVSDAREMV